MEDNFDIEECKYSIGPDGSEFYHCTPKILGPSGSSILALDYNKMRLKGIEVFYYWDRVEGQSIPCLKLSFVSGEKYRLIINCYYYWSPINYSGVTRIKPLPDLNPFTPFTEHVSSLEIKFYWNSIIGDTSIRSVSDSSILLKNEYASLEVNFFEMSFEVEKIESEDK